jgi:hypothetical protein
MALEQAVPGAAFCSVSPVPDEEVAWEWATAATTLPTTATASRKHVPMIALVINMALGAP